jgi:hypothetical protein
MERDPANRGVEYWFVTSGAPVQVEGHYRDVTFAFRARWEEWDFVLLRSSEFKAGDVADLTWYDLEAVQRSENPFPEKLVRAFREAFVRSGTYGKPRSCAASYMPKEDALEIIRQCIAEWELNGGGKGNVPQSG